MTPLPTGTVVLDLLTSLVDKSLVMVEPSTDVARYRLLDTVREYCRERLAAPDLALLQDRHLRHYTAVAEAAELHLRGPAQQRWLLRLNREYDNLRAALGWSLGRSEAVGWGLRLAAAAFTLEQARERAWNHTTTAFGAFSRLLLRPRGDEITVASIEKRFDPLWHAVAHKRLGYDRGREYRMPVADQTVRSVTIDPADPLRGRPGTSGRPGGKKAAETINLVIPGGAIPLEIGKALLDRQHTKP